jgi:hypothetical protein
VPIASGDAVFAFEGARLKGERDFATAAASLRQSLHDFADFAAASKQTFIEETKDGLNIKLTGRPIDVCRGQ